MQRGRMSIVINLDRAIYRWQSTHNERLTYTTLARRTGIPLATLNRMKSGNLIYPDLRKIDVLCDVLECEPGDLFQRVNSRE